MRRYLVLTPPGGPDSDHRSTLVLRDGFSWTAFLFPWIWLFWNRLWLAGAAVLLAQVASGFLMRMPQFEFAGLLLGVATGLLVGLEGRYYRSEALIRRGWTLETVISAQNLLTAEEIYFAGLPEPETQPMPASQEWTRQSKPAAASGAAWQGPLSLFEHGGR